MILLQTMEKILYFLFRQEEKYNNFDFTKNKKTDIFVISICIHYN